jgi:hypothetical protein
MRDAREDGERPSGDVPAVETIEATDRDADTACRQREERDGPRCRTTPSELHLPFDDAQREEPGEEPAEREREEHHRVVEHRAAWTGLAEDEVDEIGDEIRRVREKEEPCDDEQRERDAPSRTRGEVRDAEREPEWNPREEQIPHEERISARPGEDDARRDQRNAERGGQPESGEKPRETSEGHTRNRTPDALELFPPTCRRTPPPLPAVSCVSS